MNNSYYVRAFSVLPTGLCLYNYYIGDKVSRPKQPKINLHTKASLSNKQSNRIRKYINWLYLLSTSKSVYQQSTGKYFKFRVNFITLTLSTQQVHTDKEINKILLQPFLRALRRKYPTLLYVWKAEVQDNDNIHFHINTNIFIHYKDLRELWNKYQLKNSYIDIDNNPDPNSTDIHSVINAQQLGSYMSGYIAKKDLYKKPLKQWLKANHKKHSTAKLSNELMPDYFNNLKRKVNMKLWDCSSDLKKIKITNYDYSLALDNEIDTIIKDKECIEGDYFEYYSGIDWLKINEKEMSKFIQEKLKAIRDRVGHEAQRIVIA